MWCPKCDMDFIDGVTVCTDCGGELVDKEAWLLQQAEAEAAKEAEELAKTAALKASIDNLSDEDAELLEERKQALRSMMREPSVYEDSKKKYDDNKSSASAFLIVGILLAAASAALWTGALRLGIIANIAVTVFALFCFAVSFVSNKSAEGFKKSMKAEEDTYNSILSEFTEKHDAEELDAQISGELCVEEMALARLDLIQDILTNEYVIEDKTMAAAIAEDAYSKLYE